MDKESQLFTEIQDLKTKIVNLESRLTGVEDRLNIPQRTQLAASKPPLPPRNNLGFEERDEREIEEKLGDFKEQYSTETKARPQSWEPSPDFGLKVLGVVGITALVLGIGFFVKYAFDNNWINYFWRIVLGIAFGTGIHLLGHIAYQRQEFRKWSQLLLGGGIAIVYFCVYAAYHFPQYQDQIGISLTTDIILLIVIAVWGVVTAVRMNSLVIAAGAFFLAFLTAFLSLELQVFTLIYGLILSMGIGAVSVLKRWSILSFGGVLASYGLFLFWNFENNPDLAVSAFFLGSFFVSFVIQSILIYQDNINAKEDYALATGAVNSGLFFILSYHDVLTLFPDFKGLYVLFLASIHFVLFILCKYFKKESLSYLFFYLALGLESFAIALLFTDQWISLAWTVQFSVLALMAAKVNKQYFTISSSVMGVSTLWRLITVDLPGLETYTMGGPENASRILGFGLSILAVLVVYLIQSQWQERLSSTVNRLREVYPIIFTFLLGLFLFRIIPSDWIGLAGIVSASFLLLLRGHLFSEITGIDLRDKTLEFSAYALSVIALIKVFLVDAIQLPMFSITVFSDSLFQGFLLAFIFVYLLIVQIYLNKSRFSQDSWLMAKLYLWSGTMMTVIGVAMLFEGFFVSGIWAVSGLCALILGFQLRHRIIRIQGLVLFALVTFKVFIYDTSDLDPIYRTLSFIVLGIILLFASFLYSKYRRQIKDII